MKNTIYVQIKAGLGNQMFQYAFGRALSLRKKKELALDSKWYHKHGSKDTPRSFELDKYNIKARSATSEELRPFKTKWQLLLRKIKRRLIYKKDHVYNPKEANSDQTYFEGHWTNEKYFKEFEDTIRNDFLPAHPLKDASAQVLSEIEKIIEEGHIPISIHVRRGDCVTNPHAAAYQGTVDTSYYDAARDYLFSLFPKEQCIFFVFSDDIAWAKEHIQTGAKTIYVSQPGIPDYEELYLMSRCLHHIIANSSFSWWGAWLNPYSKKIIIAPKAWLKDTSFDTSDVCPKEWIRI